MKIIFVCYGNICRSPMAEYIFKDKLKEKKINGIEVLSRATSAEEEGNPCYPNASIVLDSLGIDCSAHVSKKITKAECDSADLLICMDMYNVWSLKEIAGEENSYKIKRLLEYSSHLRDIDDPWYTRDFKRSCREITEGLNGLIKTLENK